MKPGEGGSETTKKLPEIALHSPAPLINFISPPAQKFSDLVGGQVVQTCHEWPAGELNFVRNQRRPVCHSVISAPVAPGAQYEPAASPVRRSQSQFPLITSDLADASAKVGWVGENPRKARIAPPPPAHTRGIIKQSPGAHV